MNTKILNARILVVDDQQTNIDVLHDFLEMQGYLNIKTTTDSRNVVGLLDEFRPDIILLDLSMPFLSGFDIMEQLKTIVDPTTYLPILVLTADVTIEARRKALQYGASDFLTKPFDLIELQARVNTHLQIKFKNEQIKEYAQELEKLIATKDKFFSIIAHDLRNPFIGIENFIEIILRLGNYDVKDFENQLRTIYSTAQQGHELLENLLKWSRSQTGSIVLNFESVNLKNTIAKCLNIVQSQAENKKIKLISEVPDTLIINTDQDVLETIIRNLLSNAVKFTNYDGKIILNAGLKNGSLEISVSDTGIGISEFDRNKLFKIDSKLQSRNGTSGETGSGLGLILCKEFVDKLNGNIWVESEVGKGTTFKFTIPVG